MRVSSFGGPRVFSRIAGWCGRDGPFSVTPRASASRCQKPLREHELDADSAIGALEPVLSACHSIVSQGDSGVSLPLDVEHRRA